MNTIKLPVMIFSKMFNDINWMKVFSVQILLRECHFVAFQVLALSMAVDLALGYLLKGVWLPLAP